jgi:hypothetical protein
MFFLETALLAVYFNPDQYLPGFVAAAVVLARCWSLITGKSPPAAVDAANQGPRK